MKRYKSFTEQTNPKITNHKITSILRIRNASNNEDRRIQSHALRLENWDKDISIKHIYSPPRSMLLRSNPIEPMIGSDEISSWIPYDRNFEFLQCFQGILSEAILVRERTTWLIYTTVDGAAHMSCRINA